ncbi:MAG: ABC transporter permease [Candidatus Bathyarchaeia archaeon]
MMEVLTYTFLITFIAMSFRMATPILLGTLGEAFAERSGVLNLGIEGTMLMGASIGFIAALLTGNLWFGILVAAFVGMLMGLLMAFLSVTLGAQQHVAGLGTTFFGTGLSFYLYRLFVAPEGGVPPTITPFRPIEIPGLREIPVLGPTLFTQPALVYLALLLIPITGIIFYRTTFGLNMIATGQDPKAVDTAGINIFRIRYLCLLIAGTLAGVAGAWFSMVQSSQFLPGMTMGRGWVCIALVIFANWSPYRILGGALIFGGVDALQTTLSALGVAFPYRILQMLPYIFTIIILMMVARRATYPAALLKPYRREE